ncbi:MAG TPA: hypothetical protein VIF15_12110 [Polyangiaceae bacterium]|jgi:hypothetical protein
MLALCALAPACLTASHVGDVADAAHDAGVARVLGLDAQPWRALDVAVGTLFAAAPLGTRDARAAMGGALVAAFAGVTLYFLAREIAAACADAPRLGALTAAIATLAAVVAPAWQLEAGATAGSTTGALLVLLPVAALARAAAPGSRPPWRGAAFALGLALGHEPLVGATALVACAALVGAGAAVRRGLVTAWRADARAIVACLLAGLAPWILALARTRASGAPLLGALGEAWAGDRGASLAGSPGTFVRTELGPMLGALAVGGVVVAALVPRARPLAAGLLAVVVVGFASSWAGAPVGPTRFGAPVLAATAASCALAGVAMQAIVRAIAEARLPFARASAAMVLILELALPADSADEALVRSLPRARGAAAAWDDLAWGALPPRTVVLVTDRRLWTRAASARARGSLRGDVAVVPTFAHGALARRVLARDAALVPLWRDLELNGSPSEASLSSLASERPLAMAYEPRWGRTLGRHLVPIALLDRFEPEPRGASDRRRALEAFAPKRERLARIAARDPELAGSAAYLLRARALDVAASGDRDLVGRVVEDLHAFAPDDAVAAEIVARTVLGKGAPRVDDLRP